MTVALSSHSSYAAPQAHAYSEKMEYHSTPRSSTPFAPMRTRPGTSETSAMALPSIASMLSREQPPAPSAPAAQLPHSATPASIPPHSASNTSSSAPGYPPTRDYPPRLYVPANISTPVSAGAMSPTDRPYDNTPTSASPNSANPHYAPVNAFDQRHVYPGNPRYSPATTDLNDRTRPASQHGAFAPHNVQHGVPTPPVQSSGPVPTRYNGPPPPVGYPSGQMPLPGYNGYESNIRPAVDGHLQTWDYKDLLHKSANASHTVANFCDHYLRATDPNSPEASNGIGMPSAREVSEMINNLDMIRQSLMGVRSYIDEHTNRRISMTPPRGGIAETRKRRGAKRAAPPGRCHSCARIDTPEWRRGPDGARTLCNACGLHYAKLERKRLSEQRADAATKGN